MTDSVELLKYNLVKRVTSTEDLGIAYIRDEAKIRFIIENADSGNNVRVEGRLIGQTDFVVLANISGSDNEVVDVSTYEEIKVSITAYDSLSNYVDVFASSFDNVTTSATGAATWGMISGSLSNQSDLQSALDDKEDLVNKATDFSTINDDLYPSVEAVEEQLLDEAGGLPSNVIITPLNKSQWFQSKDGIILQQLDSATQTNTAGAYNGGGTGQKIFTEIYGYNNALLSTISSLGFNAKNLRDGGPSGQQGNLSFNILMNFSNGFLTAANDYAILVNDGLPALFTQFYIVSNTAFTDYTVLNTDRAFKCVGGTGVINFTGNTTIGSADVTAVSGSNINALTVGMYVRKTPTGVTAASEANMPFPDGSVIQSIDVPGNKFTVYFNGSPALAAVNGTGTSFKQYGGVAPVNRSGTANGTTTISAITNTADLQVNMKVTGTGVPANSYIVSMVANTSITLNNSVPAGAVTLSFTATGKTGIPGNAENVGIPLSQIVANNPSAFITENAPLTPIWAANDGGSPKNFTKMGGILLNQGSSSITTHRTNIINSISVNSTIYKFKR